VRFGITSKIIYGNKKATDVLVACWPVYRPLWVIFGFGHSHGR
jgi:hypothetical protein